MAQVLTAPISLVGMDAIQQMLDLVKLTPQGDIVEFGVYKGGTAWHLAQFCAAQNPSRILQLFDTFNGIPIATPEDLQHKVGDFNDTSFEEVQKALYPYHEHIVYHVGYFPETMPEAWRVSKGPTPFISFIHVDADQYTSIRDCIRLLWPLVVYKGIIYFDDYRHTSGCKKAVDEAFDVGEIGFTSQGRPYVVKK